jgi:hypothetical protein
VLKSESRQKKNLLKVFHNKSQKREKKNIYFIHQRSDPGANRNQFCGWKMKTYFIFIEILTNE